MQKIIGIAVYTVTVLLIVTINLMISGVFS